MAFFKTIAAVYKERKKIEVIVLVSPPNIILYTIPFIRVIGSFKIILDCHNGTFSDFWSKIPFFRQLIKSPDLLLFHNEDFKDEVEQKFHLVDVLAKVVPDPPAIPTGQIQRKKILIPYFVFPASFASDEPLEVLVSYLESSDFVNNECFVYITGPKHKLDLELRNRLESIQNVTLTGFLANQEYEKLFSGATGIFCFTTKENTQLCAINEAIGYERVPIYSATKTLKKMYGTIGIAVNKNLIGLDKCIKNCIDNQRVLQRGIKEEKSRRLKLWNKEYYDLFS
ncbi:hypothetical protein [Marinoscillum sp. MHG1-6]|uniref:hypothetical protein n=1 Tax=Marinoscillum sp. MHG1-6 TaxID=2959627 RepID=UPI0021585C9D|nr:hypothetical protein [Marinoscillum sp. MHG1-6]